MNLRKIFIFRFMLLTALLLGGLVSLSAQFAGGKGTEEDPWQIETAEHLDNVRNYLGEEHRDKYFIQTANIDLTDFLWDENAEEYINDGEGWVPIGLSEDRYYGNYIGGGHTINGLFINRPATHHQGLFGYTEGAQISNLGLTNTNVTGFSHTGGLVGSNENSIILNCFSTGSVTGNHTATGGLVGHNISSSISKCHFEGNVKGDYHIGGLVGENQASTVSNSYSSGTVTANETRGGGLIGSIRDNSEVSNSFSTANVNGNNRIGGFAGYVSESSIDNCYSVGNVLGNREVGGLVGTSGQSVISNSHSKSNVTADDVMVGGLVGYNSSEAVIISCHSSGEVSGGTNNVGGLVGNNGWSSTVSKSYSTGDVIGTDQRVGGLVGNNNSSSIINNSYSTGSVKGIDRVGGLAGQNYQSIIIHSFSTGLVSGNTNVGGLSGLIDTGGSFEEINNYWDTQTSGQGSSAGGKGRTTAEMTYPHAENTYVNWDFNDIWKADVDGDINNGYPYIKEDAVSVDDDYIPITSSISLSNYPNPFNPETTIDLTLPEHGEIRLIVYNIKGQQIKTLINGHREVGEHRVVWNGNDNNGRPVGSGVYFYRLTTDHYDQVNKMLLAK